jgi:antirestriction protein
MTTPRIYVASLADYNAGTLHGEWIDASQDADDINSAIQAMLKKSKEPIAEDWAIHDFEGFGSYNLSEHESIETVAKLAEAISDHGEIIAALMSHLGIHDVDEAIKYHEDNYAGTAKNDADFAYDFLESCGSLQEIPENLRTYFDYEAYARDMVLGGDIFSVKIDGENHYYWNH